MRRGPQSPMMKEPPPDSLQAVPRASASRIKREALKRGFVTLRMDGADKVAQGLTTMDEVLRVTQVDVM